jgi:hypothetical protein
MVCSNWQASAALYRFFCSPTFPARASKIRKSLTTLCAWRRIGGVISEAVSARTTLRRQTQFFANQLVDNQLSSVSGGRTGEIDSRRTRSIDI